jgi:tetratricopeptide (TPR) repeat protein
MSESPNKFIRFWQELKRRKVFKVIAMYAGTAFIILQLFDIIANPLQLPAWTITLVIVLLFIGFIITLLIAWIYDITPEGIKKTESVEAAKRRKSKPLSVKRGLKASDIVIAAMAVVIVILLYPKIFKRDTLEKLRSSGERIAVAVMPFHNMTNDTIWDVWQDGIQTNLISILSDNPEELKVRQIGSIAGLIQSKGLTNYASITPSVASNISQKLDAEVFIQGNINQGSNTIRINAQLIDSKTEEVYKSFQIDGLPEKIIPTIDSLSQMVKNFLIISKLGKGMTPDYHHLTTNSPEAFRYYVYGDKAFNKLDFATAVNMFSRAIDIDTNFVDAILALSGTYYNQGMYDKAKKLCLSTYKRKDLMSPLGKIKMDLNYAALFESPKEVIELENQILALDDQLPTYYHDLGYFHFILTQYDKAISAYEKSLEIYANWESKPAWVYNYTNLGLAYHKVGQYNKEKEIYKKADKDFPENADLIYRQAVLFLTEGDTVTANQYIKKYKTILSNESTSKAETMAGIASIYSEANILDKAEDYNRLALSLEPDSAIYKYHLAKFLIDNDRNINQGLELINQTLILYPNSYLVLSCKGWGLYKLGRYKEALELIEKSDSLKPIYNHEIYLHLEAAKKAVANQKNN